MSSTGDLQWTWDSERSPAEVVAALRSASRGARNSFGGGGVTARCLGARITLSRRSADMGAVLGRPRFVGRVEPRGSGSRIEGRFRYGPALSLARRLTGARSDSPWGAEEAAMRRHVEVVCEARPVDPGSP